MNTDTKPDTSLAVYQPQTVAVRPGEIYPFLVNNNVGEARVEKIYQDANSVVHLLVTVYRRYIPNGAILYQTEKTTGPMTMNDFKLRLLKGGISEIVV